MTAHTFAQVEKPAAKTQSANPSTRGTDFTGQSRFEKSILGMQRTVGNRSVQRLLQGNSAKHQNGPSNAAATRFSGGFPATVADALPASGISTSPAGNPAKAATISIIHRATGRNTTVSVNKADQHLPTSAPGKLKLLDIVRQTPPRALAKILRQCSDPDFCTPFATAAEATSEETWLRTYFLPAMDVKFGTEVHDLWESYLSRTPGSGLTRQVFATPGDPIEESFATASVVEDDQEAVLDLVVSRISRFPGGRLRPHTYTMASLTNFLSPSEMDNRPINFSNPFSKAGNIAGGIGSSSAGPDSRKIARANVVLEKIPVIGNSGYIYFELVPHYEVYDAVDLCPGQCGSPAEQIFTIPLSRLEAMGRTFDVPYVVKFQPEPETRREFYSSLPL